MQRAGQIARQLERLVVAALCLPFRVHGDWHQQLWYQGLGLCQVLLQVVCQQSSQQQTIAVVAAVFEGGNQRIQRKAVEQWHHRMTEGWRSCQATTAAGAGVWQGQCATCAAGLLPGQISQAGVTNIGLHLIWRCKAKQAAIR
ncbi:MAG TPA: hypothetical protein DHW73_00145 [Pseudomonas sp.]|nr:hypothetical protein [Pseudomonas sp.]HCL39767.1 hypothetical protein [Pseudomonas sp.]